MSYAEISSSINTFKLVDLLDIAIVAAMIYYFLGLIHKTRAGQLAKGAVVVLIIYGVAVWAKMRAVSWIMQSVVQVGFLAVVVLFQPEIRRALEQMGQTDKWTATLFHNQHMDASVRGKWRSAIIAICDAAERLSETRTGALIVLERKTNLSEIIRTGTIVNSEVNAGVLGTIFYEGTPLHDGAVIVQDGMIKAAGCVLPLSNNLELGKDMGTRHRAGLGIAENSDAVVIIVSEETGIISVAKNGVLIRHQERQGLYSLLETEMIPKELTADQKKKQNPLGKFLEQLFGVREKKEGTKHE
ncbi:MAG: diadenylate cyclase CdaA [Faecalibacterium sp.]